MKLLKMLDDGLERVLGWAWRNRQVLATVGALCLAGWALSSEDTAEPEARPAVLAEASAEPLGPALYDRLWVDHLPKNHKDSFRMYFFLKNKKHPIGVHLIFHSLTYRTQEFFGHEIKGKKVKFEFLDPKVKAITKVTTSGVKKKEHFDMKATFERDPQTKGAEYTYYRLKKQTGKNILADWGISDEALRAQLAAH